MQLFLVAQLFHRHTITMQDACQPDLFGYDTALAAIVSCGLQDEAQVTDLSWSTPR